MAKVISQDTFDEVVKENVVEFSMTPSEAKEETIKQFEAQVSGSWDFNTNDSQNISFAGHKPGQHH